MKNLINYIFEHIIIEKLNLKNIPTDSSLSDNVKEYDGEPQYRYYSYFGDCVNTVDKDHIWDATQMSNWIHNKCEVVSPKLILDKIRNGDRKFPKRAQKIIDKLKQSNQLEDTSKIVCGLDDYQRIMFIYLTDTDTHYFFDCE